MSVLFVGIFFVKTVVIWLLLLLIVVLVFLVGLVLFGVFLL